MTALSGIPILISFFLLGLTEGAWATINGKVLGVIFIVTAVLIAIDLVTVYRGRPVVRNRTVTQ